MLFDFSCLLLFIDEVHSSVHMLHLYFNNWFNQCVLIGSEVIMLPLVMFSIFSLFLSGILSVVGHRLPTRSPNVEKLSPYECGFEPHVSARLPFSLRFFLVAILFLLFDLEIALLLPLPTALASLNPITAFVLSFVILLILTLGLVYEWLQGGLEWAE